MEHTSVLLSVVTPAYNEAANLPVLYQDLCRVLDAADLSWEWVVVDDHSRDDTFLTIQSLAARDPRVRGIRLARNSGSHNALACGLHHARGACAAVMAADLQDPPDMLPQLLAEWRKGAQIVWAVRAGREGEPLSVRGFSRLYYFIMRKLVGFKELPATGADFFLLDRRVVDAYRQFNEVNTSLFALIASMGFRQSFIPYVKQPRRSGRSGWTLARKVKLVVDSITSFSYFPIRWMSMLGLGVSLLGFLYAGFIVLHALFGNPPQGWASLIVVVLVLGGVQLLMMGVLGEYLWRALDETRRRPRYLIEASTEDSPEDRSHD